MTAASALGRLSLALVCPPALSCAVLPSHLVVRLLPGAIIAFAIRIAIGLASSPA
jgi:hypothetical protein